MKEEKMDNKRKWATDVAGGQEKVYGSKNAGKVKESEEVGATGYTRKNDIGKNYGDHGPE